MTTNSKFFTDKSGHAVPLLGFAKGGTQAIDIGPSDTVSTSLLPDGWTRAFYTLRAVGDCIVAFGSADTVATAANDAVILDGDVYDVVVTSDSKFVVCKGLAGSTGKLYVMRRA